MKPLKVTCTIIATIHNIVCITTPKVANFTNHPSINTINAINAAVSKSPPIALMPVTNQSIAPAFAIYLTL